MNWSSAVQFCSEMGMVLRKSKLGLAERQIGKYWTREYRKKSDLMYLYGCSNTYVVNISEHMTMDQCIKECLDKSPHLFVKHVNGCSCYSDPVPIRKPQCDLKHSQFVFGTIGTLTRTSRESCVQIVCDGKNPKLVHVNCDQTANVMCGSKVIAGNFTWEGAMKECNNAKPILHIELKKTCSNSNTQGDSYWFGFGTVEYTDEYIKFNGVQDVNPTNCQGCEEDCQFHDCNEKKRAACENVVNPVNNNTTTPKYQSYQSTNEARHQTTESGQHWITKVTLHRTTEATPLQTTEDTWDRTTRDLSGLLPEDADDIVTIYCVSILPPVLIFFFVCLIYLRCRHKKRQTLENKSGISNNTPTENTALKTAVYELADNSKLDFSDPNHTVIKTTDTNTVKEHGETDGPIGGETKLTMTYTKEDIYNHLWEKPADSCQEKENIYNQCNLGIEEMSKYCVTGGPHSATVTSNYDQVTLVSENV